MSCSSAVSIGYETMTGKTAMVLELCSLGSLMTMVKNFGCMTETVARKYFIQMFSAIKYIHNEGNY